MKPHGTGKMIYADVIKIMKDLEEVHKRYRPDKSEIHNMCVDGNNKGYAAVTVLYDGMTLQRLLEIKNDQDEINSFNSSNHTGWNLHTMAISRVQGISEHIDSGAATVYTDEGTIDGNSVVGNAKDLTQAMAEMIAKRLMS